MLGFYQICQFQYYKSVLNFPTIEYNCTHIHVTTQ